MKRHLGKLVTTVEGWVKLSIGLVALIGGLWGGMLGLNAYLRTEYARAAEFAQHKQQVGKELSETKILILKQDVRALRQEKFMIEDAKDRRPLRETERFRLREIEDSLNGVENDIKTQTAK